NGREPHHPGRYQPGRWRLARPSGRAWPRVGLCSYPVPEAGCNESLRTRGVYLVPFLLVGASEGFVEASERFVGASEGILPGCPRVEAIAGSLIPSCAASE